MFKAFTVLRQLHELLWYLAEAEELGLDAALGTEVAAVRAETEAIAASAAETVADFDAGSHRRRGGELLEWVSHAVRSSIVNRADDRRDADLIGADLAGVDLHGGSLRGAYLLGANLSRADLRWTDLLGADLRAADLRGADLTGALFLTQPQLEAAAGDASTVIPPRLDRPAHWVR
jgi:hypothetical protein